LLLYCLIIPRLTGKPDTNNELEVLLALFKAKTEEDLTRLEELEVPVVTQAIKAYREVTVSDEFRELERLRFKARHNEASALEHATLKEREKWQKVVAEKEAALAEKDAIIEQLRARLG
jgi:hypothetical protein